MLSMPHDGPIGQSTGAWPQARMVSLFARGSQTPSSPPPGDAPQHFRDPHVFHEAEAGLFHLLASAYWEDYPLAGRGGCLAHITSTDLQQWQWTDPFLIPGFSGVPECSDYFSWNGWHYLLFSCGAVAPTACRASRSVPGCAPHPIRFMGRRLAC
jgi:sucrose-6-phosphate hydrolase SacC (GH32 family)